MGNEPDDEPIVGLPARGTLGPLLDQTEAIGAAARAMNARLNLDLSSTRELAASIEDAQQAAATAARLRNDTAAAQIEGTKQIAELAGSMATLATELQTASEDAANAASKAQKILVATLVVSVLTLLAAVLVPLFA